jgi:hypothetical protein
MGAVSNLTAQISLYLFSPRKRLMSPEAVPKKKKISVIQGFVFNHLSRMYPKKRPTTIEEGSMRANELT